MPPAVRIDKVSEFTTHRLSVYLRCLATLEGEGVETTSSKVLAERFSLNSAQIRKDLAYFGQFGVRGVGYPVRQLKQQITGILGLDSHHNVCIVGGGNLGMALAEYDGFREHGFPIVAVFDSSPVKIGKASRSGVPIYDIRNLSAVAESLKIEMAVVAVPAEAAKKVCDTVFDAGIRTILNFAPVRLQARPGTKVQSIDLSISLEGLSFFLSNRVALTS